MAESKSKRKNGKKRAPQRKAPPKAPTKAEIQEAEQEVKKNKKREVKANIFIVNVSAPDVNERMASLESSVDMIGSTLLDMQMAGISEDTNAQVVQ